MFVAGLPCIISHINASAQRKSCCGCIKVAAGSCWGKAKSPWWRQPSLKHFWLRLRHVMQVGHLEPPMAWRSLLYPSPARFPMAWRVTQLAVPMPRDLPSPELLATARYWSECLQGCRIAALPGCEVARVAGRAAQLQSCRASDNTLW